MQTMDASLAGLVRAGKITMATAESRSSPAGRAAPPRAGRRHTPTAGGRLMGAAVWTYKAVDGAGVPSKGELKGVIQGRRSPSSSRRAG